MNTGHVGHVCVSKQKGTVKSAVPSAVMRADHGLVGDAHAGSGHRQVSLLDDSDIHSMRARGFDLQPGAFGENVVTNGVELAKLGIGSRLQVGEAVLEVTQVGKVCHNRCAIYQRTGDCIMPRAGVFARVVRGAEIAHDTPITVLNQVPRTTIQAAVITVSDRCSRGTAKDTAGPAISQLLRDRLNAHIAEAVIVPDESDHIADTIREFADRSYNLVVTVGGTGFGPRDVTPEATRRVIEREAPGLAEAMRAASLASTPYAALQRGVCGLLRHMLVINLPGSEQGSTENLKAIQPVLPHAIGLARDQVQHSRQPSTSSGQHGAA